jgi:hypothetical protein
MATRARRPVYRRSGPQRLVAKNAESWLKQSLTRVLETGDICVSLTPKTTVALINGASVKHAYRTGAALMTDIRASVTGSPGKTIGAADTNDAALTVGGLALAADIFTGVAAAAAAAGTRVFGWHVKISGAYTNFGFRTYQLDLGPLTGGAGPVQTLDAANVVASFAIESSYPKVDILVLSVGNAGGQMTVVPGASGNSGGTAGVVVPNGLAIRSTGEATVFGNFESLTARDLIARLQPPRRSARDEAPDFSMGFDDGESEHDESYSALRDESYSALRDEL